MQTSRRKLLLTGAAAGAGLTTSAFAKAAPPKFDEVYDVVVVGGSGCREERRQNPSH